MDDRDGPLVPCVACGRQHPLADAACPHCQAPLAGKPAAVRVREAPASALVEAVIAAVAIALVALAAVDATGSTVDAVIIRCSESLSTVSELPDGALREGKFLMLHDRSNRACS